MVRFGRAGWVALIVFVLAVSLASASPVRFVEGIATRVTSLDPYLVTGFDAYATTNHIIEPLARVEPRTKALEPALAESWVIAPDKLSFTVKLREALFQDGRPVTAEDVKFTFDSYFKPEFKGEFWRGMWAGVKAVKVKSSREVEVLLNTPSFQTFVNVMTTLRILPKHFYEKPDHEKWRARILGSGPYQLLRFDPDKGVELTPYDAWWGIKTHGISMPQPLLLKPVDDPRLAEQMMRKGEMDFYLEPSAMQPNLKPATGFRLETLSSTLGEGFGLDLNLKKPLFQDVRVREALLLLWDREGLRGKLYDAHYLLAIDSFSPRLSYYPEGRPRAYDLARAKSLLKAAGWNQVAGRPYLMKDGQSFAFNILTKRAESERWISMYQADAAKAGINVSITRLEEDAQWNVRLRAGQFEAVAYEGGLSDAVHASTWRTGAPYNFTGFSDEKVDELIQKLESEFNPSSRAALEKQLILSVRKTHVQVPGLATINSYALVSKRLRIDPEKPTLAWRWRLKH